MVFKASVEPCALIASLAIWPTMAWNLSFLATKSVSEFTSTKAPVLPEMHRPTRPSAATRVDFLAALAKPLARNQSTASSRLPLVAASAALQSIMPTPVFSRRSFTIAAVISAILCPFEIKRPEQRQPLLPEPHPSHPHQRLSDVAIFRCLREQPVTRDRNKVLRHAPRRHCLGLDRSRQ